MGGFGGGGMRFSGANFGAARFGAGTFGGARMGSVVSWVRPLEVATALIEGPPSMMVQGSPATPASIMAVVDGLAAEATTGIGATVWVWALALSR